MCPDTNGGTGDYFRCTLHNRTPYKIEYKGSNFTSGGPRFEPVPPVARLSSLSFDLVKTRYMMGNWWEMAKRYSGGLMFQAQSPENQTLDFVIVRRSRTR